MSLAIPTAGPYPTIEEVFQYTRLHINDLRDGATAMIGESRVPDNPWTPSMQYLNLCIQAIQRDLEERGVPTTREVTFIVNGLTPVQSANGIPDVTAQPYLSYSGYWNGQSLAGNPTLPADLIQPLWIGQRITNSGTIFLEVQKAYGGLPSLFQGTTLGYWLFQQDRIFFNGSLNTMDIQLRYIGGMPKYAVNLNPDLWDTTLIPWVDSAEAISYKLALLYVSPRAALYPAGAVEFLESSYLGAMLQMANRWVKSQGIVCRSAFGSEGGSGGIGEGWGGSGNS